MFIVRINVDCVTLQDLSCGLVCFLGRPRRRWEDNITMDLQEVGWGDMDWIDIAQDRDSRRALVNAVMNLRVP